ncbi:Hypothetical protein CINCED_3A017873 [Cinara cedri]|uniref:Uncharacterized protein n=1 Tax=Cinara cedri TaxID=506608 RepID=A0A5E4M033_9HEMI|nr:Hypothetical protein CINCED_3A017873 [Cinara cedri]
MRSRLFTFQASHSTIKSNIYKDKYDELLQVLDVLKIQNLPDKYDIQYGDKSVRRLAMKFEVDETSIVRSFCAFEDSKNK